MSTLHTQHTWEEYRDRQLAMVVPMLADEGFVLNDEQPHIAGERAILSGPKLVLLGTRRSDDLRVVIKVTSDTEAARELSRERACRDLLHTMRFAYRTFHSPPEIMFGRHDAHTFLITALIPHDTPFIERPLEEQFFLALRAFEAQEGSQATTAEHLHEVRNAFELFDAARYVRSAERYADDVAALAPEHPRSAAAVRAAAAALADDAALLDRYGNFLTHWDLVPHNMRVHGNSIYLLDHTALRFGNKYEGWARFMNFMTLYHPALEEALDTYVRANRSEEEHRTLDRMRLYRLAELVWFYAARRATTDGDLRTLTNARIDLWGQVLAHRLAGEPVSEKLLSTYRRTRDTLRGEEEKRRQKDLH